jgi:hypothetical protein
MNNRTRSIRTHFDPETRFEVPTEPEVPFRDVLVTELEQLKNRLLREALTRHLQPALNAPLRRAANEAASLVWLLPQPLLLFPELFEEKARAALIQTQRQRSVSARSVALLSEAA